MINLENIELIDVKNPARLDDIDNVQKKMGKTFSKEYISLLLQTNGFDSDEVKLYSTNELIEQQELYEVDMYCPQYINIGDDGGGSAILIKSADYQEDRVYLVGHGVMDSKFMEVIGDDLFSWLEGGCPLEEE